MYKIVNKYCTATDISRRFPVFCRSKLFSRSDLNEIFLPSLPKSKNDKRVYELEMETLAQLKPLYRSRRDIIMGRGTFDFNDSEELLTELFRKKIELNSESSWDDSKRTKSGLPGFWLEVLNCSRLTASVIMPYDTLKFYFAPNKYFSNRVLVKEAYLEKKFSKGDPYDSACWRRLRLNSCKAALYTYKTNSLCDQSNTSPSFFNFFDSYSIWNCLNLYEHKLYHELNCCCF
ncbi:Nucleosome assembly protein 1-like [Trichinella spiralis]|uniref:Nucleosome assembly protein 1-like n=1 Tax=Trichinella spiralis TaxID=6334 RepID=A0ABR3KEC6_TRISP